MSIEGLVGVYNGKNISLSDICNKPLSPDNNNCLVQSLLGWFQDNDTLLDYQHENPFTKFVDSDYLSHIRSCIR